ncbi:MAG TPA: ferritin-like domain-containing protein [Chitinophagaceae bacterium]|nr:ferritin-like domain-containing protein [Chitinophagaceae bacterium]
MPTTAKRNTEKNALSKSEVQTALSELFTEQVKDIYWAEKHLTKALPKMMKAASSANLQEAFATHYEQTREHVVRLEQVFDLLGKKVQAKKCDAMEGLVQEGEGVIEDTVEGTATRDVGLILAAQKAEHYEISTYGGLAQLARTLGRDDIAGILEQTLAEEKETNEILTTIAEDNINYDSAEEA